MIISIIVVYTIFFLASGGSWIFGVLDSISMLETMVGIVLAIALFELNFDHYINVQEGEFALPALTCLFKGAFVLLMPVYLVAVIVAHLSGHIPLETIVFDIVFFILEASALCIVVSLSLALLRPNRHTLTRQDPVE